MIRLADYVAQHLAFLGVRHVFVVTGGGAMHLNDAIGRCSGLTYVCCHHEQACAIAAESYARVDNKLAVVNVTTGPGCINALNGVFGAWTDSIPLLVVSGQVKRETLLKTYGLNGKLRQLGDQEVDIVSMASGITKYCHLVEEPDSIRYHLEKAIYLAMSGRQGPCWIDIPIDVQSSLIDSTKLTGFQPETEMPCLQDDLWTAHLSEVVARIFQADRPLIMAGNGIHLSRSEALFLELLEQWKIPTVSAFNAHDLLWDDHPCYVGRQGTIGDRAGNFCVQNADVLMVLGSRLNVRQVSYNWKSFASRAYKIVVDVDSEELTKPMVTPDLAICADLYRFLQALLKIPVPRKNALQEAWFDWCKSRRHLYPVIKREYYNKNEPVNPYCFVGELFQQLPEGQIIVCGDATACITTFQAAKLKPNQRLWSNSGSASMGYDLPAAIGACLASSLGTIICIAGDGSIQMNLQELATISYHRYPIKIFILNNEGYHSIRQTQQNYFPDNIVGCDQKSGISFPNFQKLAGAYGLPYVRLSNHSELSETIAFAIAGNEPCICEIILDKEQQFSPKLLSRKLADGTMISPALENMWPFLDEAELKENMKPCTTGLT